MYSYIIHTFAFIWFMFCWVGYTRYATRRSKDTACLASVLHLYREEWMQHMLLRDNRIADANVIGNFERNASFFASSALAILAGILTAFGASDKAVTLLGSLPLVEQASSEAYELRLLLLALIFIYAFFTFTWCMRQYNFAAVVVGSAPLMSNADLETGQLQSFASRTAQIMSMAANAFNFGLRAYYFGMAMLAWFINPWCFMLVTAGVVWILYRREFHSEALQVLQMRSKVAEPMASVQASPLK